MRLVDSHDSLLCTDIVRHGYDLKKLPAICVVTVQWSVAACCMQTRGDHMTLSHVCNFMCLSAQSEF